jgi:hypothetical protein
MSILGMTGFESYNFTSGTATARNDAADLMDRIITLGGGFTRFSTALPDGSPSLQALAVTSTDVGSVPWHNDAAGTRNEPGTSGAFWLHDQVRIASNSTSNDQTRHGTSSDDAEYITLSWEDSTTNITLRVAGVVRATSSYATGIADYTRCMVEVTGVTLTSHTITVYVNGDLTTPIITYTLVAGDVSALAAVGSGLANGFYVRSGNTMYVDDMWAMDHLDGVGATDPTLYRDSGIRGQVPTGDGAPLNWTASGGGAGSYTDIDFVTGSDYISATAAATESQFSHTAVASNVERVGAVKVMAHVTQSDVSAGTQIGIGFDDGVAPAQKDSLVPGAGYVTNVFDEQPGGGAWTPADYDASDLIVISVA